MIEDVLINYGVLGIWTVFNLSTIAYYRKKQETREEQLTQVIRENTMALVRVSETIKFLELRKTA